MCKSIERSFKEVRTVRMVKGYTFKRYVRDV